MTMAWPLIGHSGRTTPDFCWQIISYYSEVFPRSCPRAGPKANLRIVVEKACELPHIAPMNPPNLLPHRIASYRDRRTFLKQLSASATFFTVPGAFAEELLRTPSQTEGPFYPDKLPLDTDNDLILVNDSLTPAVGEITYLSGRVLDERAAPIPNAVLQIWQTASKGLS